MAANLVINTASHWQTDCPAGKLCLDLNSHKVAAMADTMPLNLLSSRRQNFSASANILSCTRLRSALITCGCYSCTPRCICRKVFLDSELSAIILLVYLPLALIKHSYDQCER
jgi:hypothetical protein